MQISSPIYNHPLLLRPGVPSEISTLLLEGARSYFATFNAGTAVVQKIKDGGNSLWNSSFHLFQPTTFQYQSATPFIALHFQEDQTSLWTQGDQTVRLQPGQLNLYHLPVVDATLHLEQGTAGHTELILTRAYLEDFRDQYSILDSFLNAVDLGRITSLSPTPLFATRRLQMLLEDLKQCPFRNGFRKMYFEARIMDVLMEVLELAAGAERRPFRLNAEDVRRILTIKELLETQPQLRLTVRQLARKVLLNESKLRKGFREVTGMNLFDFHLEIRMQKAKTLLEENIRSLEDIGEQSGYQHLSSFIAAFKEINGITPAVYRRMHGK